MASSKVENAWQFNKNVCERNEHMFENELATDVVFKVSSSLQGETRTIRAHTYMLISASPVFWAMFCGDMNEECDVIVPDVEPEAFSHMLRYIYTDKISLTGHNLMHVLHAAKKYQLPSLVQQCITFLGKELSATNACSIFQHSRFFNEEAFAQKCLEKIEENTEEALSSDDFISVSKNTLSAILDSDKLSIKELKLFDRSCEWARRNIKNAESIREALGECFFKIRFTIIPMKEFIEEICSKDVLNKDEQFELLKYMGAPTPSTKPQAFNCEQRMPAGTRISPGQTVRIKRNKCYGANTSPQVQFFWKTLTPQSLLTVLSITDAHVLVLPMDASYTFDIPIEDIVT